MDVLTRIPGGDGFSLPGDGMHRLWGVGFQNYELSVLMNRRVKRQIIIALTILVGIFAAFALIAQFA